MPETENPHSEPRFIRRSDTESTCTVCFRSISTERPAVLAEAEDIHADVCLARPDSQLNYILL
jgi:hypothetical protein